jgi:hypothetical protein
MSLVGVELNATCVRAVRGPLGDYPWTQCLDGSRAELPLVVSLEGRTPVVGGAGLRLCRKAPQLVWLNVLPRLGELGEAAPAGRRWVDGRQRLDPARAVTLVLQQVARTCRESRGAVLALPAYLSSAQVALLLTLADQAGLPVLGSISTPLAAALAAHAEQAWFGATVVLDIDDQALTLTTVASTQGQAQLLDVRCRPQLGLRLWRERLLNALADCYILDSRWDPREAPAAEQALFDQLDEVLDAAQQGRMAKLTVEAPGRFQNLVLQAHDPAAFCSALRRQVVDEVEAIVKSPWPDGAPGVILLTAAVARLPGMVADLQALMPVWAGPDTRRPRTSLSTLEDFGTHLLDEPAADAGSVVVLSPDAPARGAHSVAVYFQRGDIACGHLPAAAPLPLPLPLEAGPARLHFQGRDHLLGSSSFVIGRQAGVDLVFDAEMWPKVSPRHCEIIYDHRTHMLCNRGREGTLVNDCLATQAVPLRGGDWIRLGADGPMLRFLGHSTDLRTTA